MKELSKITDEELIQLAKNIIGLELTDFPWLLAGRSMVNSFVNKKDVNLNPNIPIYLESIGYYIS